MGQTIDTRHPDKPVSGASLMRNSVAGRKTQFILQSTVGSASFTLAAGAVGSITLILRLWSLDLPTAALNTTNLISYDNSIAWAFEDVYIDSDLTTANYIGASTLSSGQGKVVMNKMDQMTPSLYSGSTRYSNTTRYIITNNDSSSHTIYFYAQTKYIIIGDANL